jgi:hypothetical protein
MYSAHTRFLAMELFSGLAGFVVVRPGTWGRSLKPTDKIHRVQR